MMSLYKFLIRLYPASCRREYGEEMVEVFLEAREEAKKKTIARLALFWCREISGLVASAISEHVRSLADSDREFYCQLRRFTMHTEFRFPKATPVLMGIILVGTILAIKKAQAIAASLPHINPPVGPIQPGHLTIMHPLLLMFGMAYAAGFIGWAILFALKRSGLHRLSAMHDLPNR